MNNWKRLNITFNIGVICFLLISSNYFKNLSQKPSIQISKQDSSVNFNSLFLNIINSGNKRLISSFLWISTILESDIEHYREKNLNSWMYLRFKSILSLDQKFYQVYLYGGQYLSIIKDDLFGASDLYKAGLKEYPNDFPLLKDAIFHFHYEVKDYKTSYSLLEKLQRFKNAPPVYQTALAKLEKENGNIETAYFLLKESLKKIPEDSVIYSVVKNNIYSLRAENDLNCLNAQKKDCSFYDEDGERYLNKNGIYYALKDWKPFQLNK